MFCVYILENRRGKHYIGYTKNVEQRIDRHNKNKVFSTKNKGPWQVVHCEMFLSQKEALEREKQIKKYKGGTAFKRLLSGEVAESG